MCWGFRADLTLPKVGFSSLWCNNLSWKVRFAAVNVTKVQIYCGTATSTRDFFFFLFLFLFQDTNDIERLSSCVSQDILVLNES